MIERRTVAAIALSIAVLFLFRYYQERRLAEMAPKRPPASVEPAPAPPPVPAPSPAPAEAPAEPVAQTQSKEGDTAASARQIVVECPLYRAELDNRGGLLTTWELKAFTTARGQRFDMIPPLRSGDRAAYPGALLLDEPDAGKWVNLEPYEMKIEGRQTAGGSYEAPVTVSMTLRRGAVEVRKEYRFDGERYLVDYSVTADRGGRPLTGRLFLGQDIGPEVEHLAGGSAGLVAVANEGGKVKRHGPPKDENEVQRIAGDHRWLGLDMHYFALIAIPRFPVSVFEIQKRPVKTRGLDGNEISRDLLRVAVPGAGSWENRLYIGPKQQAALEAVEGADLTGVIDYGFFSFLVRPLLLSLQYIESYVHNYGVAIILLTLGLTLLLFPFRLKQMLSMKKMAVVQPKVKAIQEKYKKYKKTDPKRAEMNQEVMAVYKEHNVNPLGGCLPLLLQMPLLFAFYQLLAASIELRQAHFFGWIHDLSLKDPYYVLPIVMGVTMFISQKMTPMTPGADPTQAKMMMLMPVVFTVMFLTVSSGLNLYFLCSNIFQIAFQKISERWIGGGGRADKSSG